MLHEDAYWGYTIVDQRCIIAPIVMHTLTNTGKLVLCVGLMWDGLAETVRQGYCIVAPCLSHQLGLLADMAISIPYPFCDKPDLIVLGKSEAGPGYATHLATYIYIDAPTTYLSIAMVICMPFFLQFISNVSRVMSAKRQS